MAIDSVSSISPIMAQRYLTRLDRPPKTTPDAQASAGQETANPSTVGTPVGVSPVANDVEAMLREAGAQISRASQPGGQTPADLRTSTQAYNTEAGALDELAVQREGNGSRTLDVLA